MEPLHVRLPRSRRSAPSRATSSACEGPRSTPSRCTRSRTPSGSRMHVLERWEAADRDPALVEDGALNIVVVGGGPTGVERAGAWPSSTASDFAQGLPGACPQEQARIILVEAGPRSSRCSRRTSAPTREKALEKRGVEVMTGEVVESVSPTRVTLEVGNRAQRRTRWSGAPACRASPLVESLGLELQRGNRIAVDPELAAPGSPGGLRGRRHRLRSPTRRRRRCSRSSARSRSRPASTRARPSRGWSRARSRSRSSTRTRGRWRRSAAARRWCRCTAAGR